MGCALQQTLKSDNPFDMKQRRAKDFIEAPNSWSLLLLALHVRYDAARFLVAIGAIADIPPTSPNRRR